MELTSTLHRLEAKLDRLAELKSGGQTPDQPGNLATMFEMRSEFPAYNSLHQGQHVSMLQNSPSQNRAPNRILQAATMSPRQSGELALPQKHSTAPQNMLSWPCSPLKLEPSELRYPIDLEIRRPRLSRSTDSPYCLSAFSGSDDWLSAISLSQLRALTQSYFDRVHPHCLIIDEEKFHTSHLNQGLRTNFREGLDACLVLLVFALGSIVAYDAGKHEWGPALTAECPKDVGLGFFNRALTIFQEHESVNWISVQCLLLMGWVCL